MVDVGYARAGDGTHIAYRVLGADNASGCRDIVMVSGGLIPMEVFEDDPGFARLLDGLASIGRVVVFDRRGLGVSDPITDWERPILDQWADDLAAVVAASGVQDAVVFAWDGYGVATRYAARRPEGLLQLVLHNPFSVPTEGWEAWVSARRALIRDNVAGRADGIVSQLAPSHVADQSFLDWYARAGRVGASPTTADRIWESVFSSRPDAQLEQIDVPTLVLYRRDNVYTAADTVRSAASQIRGATVVELEGADHFPFLGDVDAIVAEIAGFVVGERRLPPPQRLLAAVMFTDLVGSTERAAVLGDAHWKTVLDRHDIAVRAAVGRCGGTVIETTGDGVLALLPSAGVAVQAAERVRTVLATDGHDVRIGIHVGDVDRRGDDVSGLAVNIAARTTAAADVGQIVVTASVPPAVAGQAVTFISIGTHGLKGVPGDWELFQLSRDPDTHP